jgi:NhaP-type Na+/H+ or K+/H+ antiporter
MGHHEILELAIIVGLAAGSHVVANLLRVPAILVLVVAGFVAGPVTGLLDPDKLFGDLLLPLVSVAIALILFEGGLTLDLREIRGVGSVVIRLLTVGVVVTWLAGAVLAHFLLDTPFEISLLIGAVLVVSGPTVVLPILRQLRIKGPTESVLRWEGIVIDPIGVLLAVVVFQAIVAGQEPTGFEAMFAFAQNMSIGAIVGVLGALVLVPMLRSARLDDRTEVAVTLAAVVGAFAVANQFAEEAGLVSATLMGVVMANQRERDLHHIHAFKETLGLLLTGVLFVVLTARVSRDLLFDLGISGVLFLLALVILVRPAVAWISTVRSGLDWRERLLIGAMAPRGIVAASTASVFAIGLQQRGNIDGAETLAPAAFVVIVGSVVIYGLGLPPLVRALGVVSTGPPSTLIVGAQPWVRDIAAELDLHDIPVTMWASNAENAQLARREGLTVREDDLLSEDLELDPKLNDLDLALVVTDNDEFNALVSDRMRAFMPREAIHQVSSQTPTRMKGTRAFDQFATYERINSWVASGARVESRPVLDFGASPLDDDDLPLLIVEPGKTVRVIQHRADVFSAEGATLVVLARTGAKLPTAHPREREGEPVPVAERPLAGLMSRVSAVVGGLGRAEVGS